MLLSYPEAQSEIELGVLWLFLFDPPTLTGLCGFYLYIFGGSTGIVFQGLQKGIAAILKILSRKELFKLKALNGSYFYNSMLEVGRPLDSENCQV